MIKVHLPAEEAAIVSAGDDYKVVETRWGRLGLLICWDLQFPEAARILALKGQTSSHVRHLVGRIFMVWQEPMRIRYIL